MRFVYENGVVTDANRAARNGKNIYVLRPGRIAKQRVAGRNNDDVRF
jgi:hypothetical protein